MAKQNKTWGFLRETKVAAVKAGIDPDYNIPRTGLDEYLEVIFPNVHDWVHDKGIVLPGGRTTRCRPDYRSEQLKLIVEFDGVHHYTNPKNILKDEEHNKVYRDAGYRIVRIPYFIQLTQKAVKTMFNVEVEPLFDESIPSMGVKGGNTPAYLCPAGLKRMAKDFIPFPEQYEVNVKALKQQAQGIINGVELLEQEYELLSKKMSLKLLTTLLASMFV